MSHIRYWSTQQHPYTHHCCRLVRTYVVHFKFRSICPVLRSFLTNKYVARLTETSNALLVNWRGNITLHFQLKSRFFCVRTQRSIKEYEKRNNSQEPNSIIFSFLYWTTRLKKWGNSVTNKLVWFILIAAKQQKSSSRCAFLFLVCFLQQQTNQSPFPCKFAEETFHSLTFGGVLGWLRFKERIITIRLLYHKRNERNENMAMHFGNQMCIPYNSAAPSFL